MAGRQDQHRHRSRHSLAGHPPVSPSFRRDNRGHSIWSDDAMSTRKVYLSGGYDARFNDSLGNQSPVSPVSRRDYRGRSIRGGDTGNAPIDYLSGGYDTRFNDVALDHPPLPTTQMPVPTPSSYFGGAPEIPTGGAQIIWSHRDSIMDPESQVPTQVADPPPRNNRISKRFSTVVAGSLTFWQRLRGEGREKVGWKSSLKAIATFSWINVLLIFVPIAWGVHFAPVSHAAMFMLCFLAIIPLSKLLDYGGEQLALYCGKDLGDLIVVTLNNAVDTALALVLLSKCELKLLQSTIIGVVLLRLLLVPGAAFLTGGTRVVTQELHPHVVQLNNALLMVGALTLLLPASFFGALDHTIPKGTATALVNDSTRGDFLKLSRALSMFLLVIYISSRFYLHNPPGDRDSLHEREDAPAALRAEVEKMQKEKPVVNPWVCMIMLVTTVVLLGVTSEFLVSSIHPMRHMLGIQEEWFGLFLLPLVSYSADGILSIVYFVRRNFQWYLGAPPPANTLAQGRSIDLGIQFLIFWMPLLVIFGWFAHKPMSLLFDIFEIAVLFGACFLVNYVIADAKTNWAEGMMMVVFYLMICITAWFYPGQPEIHYMLSCSSVQKSLAADFGRLHANSTTLNQTGAGINNHQHAATTEAPTAKNMLGVKLQRLLDLHRVLERANNGV